MPPMNYLEHFELSQEPFSNAPVSRLYYNSAQHAQALARLVHAVSYMKGLALLVIIHSGVTASWLLKRIALQMGVESPAEEKLELLAQLYARLLKIHEQGKKAVVLIDEAQMLATRELMEEFRGLLNLEVPERKLISFVFFGLPEIEQNLKLDPPLAQRVALRYRLEPFTAESTKAYLKHRLRLAGCPRMPFSPEAIAAVHRLSRGVPRVINTLCDNALFEAFVSRVDCVDVALAEQIGKSLGLGTAERLRPSAQATRPAPGASPVPELKLDLNEIDRYLAGLKRA
jgi:general secretion pathway protein A